jgi:rubrerythrin
MGLASFSAILEFAIRREEAAVAALASSAGSGPDRRDLLDRLHAEAEKDLGTLRTILRENVTEMVMEPVEPLDEAAYEPAVEPEGDEALAALSMIEKQHDFFRDAARVINLREVKRAFEKLAARKSRLAEEIRKRLSR